MRKNLPKFTTAFVWWLVLVFAVAVGWKILDDRRAGEGQGSLNPLLQLARPFLGDDQEPAAAPPVAVDEPAVPALAPDPSRETSDAAGLIERAARNLTQYRSLAARIRQRIDMFNQPLSGAGVYQQWGRGQDLRHIRLELKLQVAGQTASLQQICDGRFLWDRRDILGAVTLSRIDLIKVRQALAAESQPASPSAFRHWMALGGLAQLLTGIDEHFEFREAEPATLGRLPVWVLVGTPRKSMLERLFAAPVDSPQAQRPVTDRLPAHWPARVVVVLGADENIPLFPYRIEYQRRAESSGRADSGEPRFESQATLELFEVQPSAELDPELFRYTPGNQEVVDQTQEFLRKLLDDRATANLPGPVD